MFSKKKFPNALTFWQQGRFLIKPGFKHNLNKQGKLQTNNKSNYSSVKMQGKEALDYHK